MIIRTLSLTASLQDHVGKLVPEMSSHTGFCCIMRWRTWRWCGDDWLRTLKAPVKSPHNNTWVLLRAAYSSCHPATSIKASSR